MKRKHSIKKIFAVMFAFAILIGVTACGSNNEQTGERGSTGQMEENQPIEVEDSGTDNVTDPASVNLDGGDVTGSAQLLAEMARTTTGGDLFFIELVGNTSAASIYFFRGI